MRYTHPIGIVCLVAALRSCEKLTTSQQAELMPAKPELNETDKYILNAIRKWVWSGFYTPDDVDLMIDDILEEDAHEEFLRDSVATEFQRKSEAEKNWPEQTDCDRLDAAFEALEKRNILCLQNSGYEMSDGHQEAFEILSDRPGHRYIGYCFYHGQDLERAVDEGGLMMAFDHVDGDVPDKIKIGVALKVELERFGFVIEWSGTTSERINIPKIDWKRRYQSGR